MRVTRRAGRPAVGLRLDAALAAWGGFRSYVERMVAADIPDRLIVANIARDAGVPVSIRTLRRYRASWAAVTEEVTAA